jgi:hypothetical protein
VAVLVIALGVTFFSAVEALYRITQFVSCARYAIDPAAYVALLSFGPDVALEARLEDLTLRVMIAECSRHTLLLGLHGVGVLLFVWLALRPASAAWTAHAWALTAIALHAFSLLVDFTTSVPAQIEYQRLSAPLLSTPDLSATTLQQISTALLLAVTVGAAVTQMSVPVCALWAARRASR